MALLEAKYAVIQNSLSLIRRHCSHGLGRSDCSADGLIYDGSVSHCDAGRDFACVLVSDLEIGVRGYRLVGEVKWIRFV